MALVELVESQPESRRTLWPVTWRFCPAPALVLTVAVSFGGMPRHMQSACTFSGAVSVSSRSAPVCTFSLSAFRESPEHLDISLVAGLP